MSKRDKPSRPTVVERYQQFMDLQSLNELIVILEIAYRETKNEKVLLALHKLQGAKDSWMVKEERWREEEIVELLTHLDDYPESVRIWILHYRDGEIE